LRGVGSTAVFPSNLRRCGRRRPRLPQRKAKLAPLVEKAGFPEKDINTGLKMFDS